MFTVPTIVKLLTEHPAVTGTTMPRSATSSTPARPMYRQDQKHALTTLGPVLVQYFGLGEVTGNITVLPPDLHTAEDGPGARAGTCGYERTGMQVSIQDDAGRELPPFATGEICVCGPAVFAGYYDNPEANAKAFRNGWFRTGDLGHLDAQGFLFITGRASDMYISRRLQRLSARDRGEAAHPPRHRRGRHPGRARPDLGRGRASPSCVLRPGAELDQAGLLDWLGGQVARYKLPRHVVVLGHAAQVRLWQDHQEGSSARSSTAAAPSRCPARPDAQRPPTGPSRRATHRHRSCGPTPIDPSSRPGSASSMGSRHCSPARSRSPPSHSIGGALGPFAYVIPSLPPDASHAAFYSDTRRPPGRSRITAAAVTLGWRDGRPFFHCHALWTHEDGTAGCGHVLPDETMIAAPHRTSPAPAFGARFEVHPDPETGFTLFTPRPDRHRAGRGRPGAGAPPGAQPGPHHHAGSRRPQRRLPPCHHPWRRREHHPGPVHRRITDRGYATELLVLARRHPGHPDAPPSEIASPSSTGRATSARAIWSPAITPCS